MLLRLRRALMKPSLLQLKQFRNTNYSVTADGKIFNTKTNKFVKTHIMGDGIGYLRCTIRIDKKSHSFLVHRMVAETYLRNVSELEFINHIDNNRTNNNVTNLEWVTRQGNVNHMLAQRRQMHGERHFRAKLNNALVTSIRALYRAGQKISSLAKQYGVSSSVMRSCIKGKTWKYV